MQVRVATILIELRSLKSHNSFLDQQNLKSVYLLSSIFMCVAVYLMQVSIRLFSCFRSLDETRIGYSVYEILFIALCAISNF